MRVLETTYRHFFASKILRAPIEYLILTRTAPRLTDCCRGVQIRVSYSDYMD